MGYGIGRGRAQEGVVLGAPRGILLLQPLLVGDRLLLDIFHVQGPTNPVVKIENVGRCLFADDTSEQGRQFHPVMDAEIEAEPAERIVDVG